MRTVHKGQLRRCQCTEITFESQNAIELEEELKERRQERLVGSGYVLGTVMPTKSVYAE